MSLSSSSSSFLLMYFQQGTCLSSSITLRRELSIKYNHHHQHHHYHRDGTCLTSSTPSLSPRWDLSIVINTIIFITEMGLVYRHQHHHLYHRDGTRLSSSTPSSLSPRWDLSIVINTIIITEMGLVYHHQHHLYLWEGNCLSSITIIVNITVITETRHCLSSLSLRRELSIKYHHHHQQQHSYHWQETCPSSSLSHYHWDGNCLSWTRDLSILLHLITEKGIIYQI